MRVRTCDEPDSSARAMDKRGIIPGLGRKEADWGLSAVAEGG